MLLGDSRPVPEPELKAAEYTRASEKVPSGSKEARFGPVGERALHGARGGRSVVQLALYGHSVKATVGALGVNLLLGGIDHVCALG